MKQIKWYYSSKALVNLGVDQRPKSTFSKYGHVAYQIKGSNACIKNGSIYFADRHTLDHGWGQKVNTFFLKVAMMHIKLEGNGAKEHHSSTYSVLTHTLSPWGLINRSKRFFPKVVILYNKLNGMAFRAPCKYIFCPYTPSIRGVGSSRGNIFFLLNMVMLHIKLKERGIDQHRSKPATLHIPYLWMVFKGQILKLYRYIYIFIEQSTKKLTGF